MKKRKATILLVHGTFASDTSWEKDASQLRKSIEERIGEVRFLELAWTGANYQSQRNVAVQNMYDLLKSSIDDETDRFCVIAHSHGGNIILKATKMLHRDYHKKITIVSLGTPFINARSRAEPDLWQWEGIGLASIFIYLMLLGLISKWLDLDDELMIWGSMPMYFFILGGFGEKFIKWWSSMSERVTRHYEKPIDIDVKWLCITHDKDEAIFFLRTSSWLSSNVDRITHIFGSIGTYGMQGFLNKKYFIRGIALLLSISVAATFSKLFLNIDVGFGGMDAYLWFMLLIIGSFIGFFVLRFAQSLLWLSSYSFKFSTIFHTMFCQVKTTTLPRGVRNPIEYKMPSRERDRKLFHSQYYSNSDVIRRISDFIEK